MMLSRLDAPQRYVLNSPDLISQLQLKDDRYSYTKRAWFISKYISMWKGFFIITGTITKVFKDCQNMDEA